jgi:arylsulfatase A-like enzyme
MLPLATSLARAAALAAVVVTVASCTGVSRTVSAPSPSHGTPPSILLVVWDTVAAAHVGCLAEDGGPTPTLDALAAEGVLFRAAYTTAPWTQPAVASILTGRYPSHHGVLRLLDTLAADNVTLAERLSAAGYSTGGVVAHELIASRLGYAQGFASWDESSVMGHDGISSERVTELAAAWLEQRGNEPFFLLAHYFDPHMLYQDHAEVDLTTPYDGPLRPGMDVWEMRNARSSMTDADIAFLRHLHREEVAHTDRSLHRLLAALAASSHADDTIVVVVADHGEEIMERGWIGHTRSLYDELIRVPLVIRLPHGPRGMVVDTPVSVIDLVPTLAELTGTEIPAGAVDGRSLALALAGGGDDQLDGRHLFAEVSYTLGPADTEHHLEKVAFMTALVDGPKKLIHDLIEDSWELHHRDLDPTEWLDRTAADADADHLRQLLAAWEASRTVGATAVSRVLPQPDEIARLRALGYLH